MVARGKEVDPSHLLIVRESDLGQARTITLVTKGLSCSLDCEQAHVGLTRDHGVVLLVAHLCFLIKLAHIDTLCKFKFDGFFDKFVCSFFRLEIGANLLGLLERLQVWQVLFNECLLGREIRFHSDMRKHVVALFALGLVLRRPSGSDLRSATNGTQRCQ